jgi:hypothetical protein
MKKENVKVGTLVKVPFMVNARGDVRLVRGKVARVFGNSASVDLTGDNKGYSVSTSIRKLRKG